MLRPVRATLTSIISLMLISVMLSCAAPGNTTKVSIGDIDVLYSSLEKGDFELKPAPFIPVDLIKLYEAGKLVEPRRQ